jgi:hypothetical protein
MAKSVGRSRVAIRDLAIPFINVISHPGEVLAKTLTKLGVQVYRADDSACWISRFPGCACEVVEVMHMVPKGRSLPAIP